VAGIHKVAEVGVDINSQDNRPKPHQCIRIMVEVEVDGMAHNNQIENLYIPKEVIESVVPPFQAILFKAREKKEKEVRRKDNQDNRKVSAASTDKLVSQVSGDTEEAKNDPDDETGTSSQFGATGREKRKTRGDTTLAVRRNGKAVYVGKLTKYKARA
jgi:hypothetical protein